MKRNHEPYFTLSLSAESRGGDSAGGDVLGNRISNFEVNGKNTVNTSQWPAGIYLWKAKQELGQTKKGKIVIAKW